MNLGDPYSISPSNRKIDPTRHAIPLKADCTPDDNDRVEIGPTPLAFREWAALGLTLPNLPRLREYRLKRIRGQLRKHDYAGILIWDPLNVRYATDCTNMQLWSTHNACRCVFVPTEGSVVLWDFHACGHLSEHLPLVNEVRHGASFFYFESGERVEEHAHAFAEQIDDLLRQYGGGNRRLAIDKMEIAGVRELEKMGIDMQPGQPVTEQARSIKDENEINAMRCAIASCEAAIDEMRLAMHPGQTENDMWAKLHYGNIIRGGEWIETRLLSSGPRTNPWFQECGPRIVQNGDLVAFDTDLIGPYGYCADLSRTQLCGDVRPTDEQCRIYSMAYEHMMANMALLKPGVSFEELTMKAQRLPEEFNDQRYGFIMHGVGLCDEYPSIRHPEDFESWGYGGELEKGMTLCVEVYMGEVNGHEGVKLEDQVLITETGYENLTCYPFEDNLLV